MPHVYSSQLSGVGHYMYVVCHASPGCIATPSHVETFHHTYFFEGGTEVEHLTSMAATELAEAAPATQVLPSVGVDLATFVPPPPPAPPV